jgi:uncharacterized membrane protein
MTREDFLIGLRAGLRGLPEADIADIIADYQAHFDEGAKSGRSEAEVAASLGDPLRLARELRAETSLKRWEEHQSPKNFFRAGWALLGLMTFDFFIVLPMIFLGLIVIGCIAFALSIIGIVGAAMLLAIMAGPFGLPVALAGLGLIAGAIGGGALMLLLMGGAMRLLGHYARLHYRLLDKEEK